MAEVDIDVGSGNTPAGQRQSELQAATLEHIDLLFQAGIATYAQLRAYKNNPGGLFDYLGYVKIRSAMGVALPSFDIIEQWILQATNELPGTVVTQVSERTPEGQRQSQLQTATPEEVELLFEAGIETYGQLREYRHRPGELFQYLSDVNATSGKGIALHGFDAIEQWVFQATNELPGTIVTKPIP